MKMYSGYSIINDEQFNIIAHVVNYKKNTIDF